MTVERVNPAVILKASLLARPEFPWIIIESADNEFHVADAGAPVLTLFDPLHDDSDCRLLERALKDERNGGWVFYKTPKGIYVAFNIDSQPQSDPSDTLLLLKAVAAQFSIPLYQVSK